MMSLDWKDNALAQFSRIQPLSSEKNCEDAEQVHAARVAIKRLRAMIALFRRKDQLRQDFSEIKRDLRHISHLLAGSRDQYVLRQTLRDIGKLHDKPKVHKASDLLLAILGESDSDRPEQQLLQQSIQKLSADISDSAPSVLPIEQIQSLLAQATDKLGKSARRALHYADADLLHAWRKQVKRLQYQCELIQDAAPGYRQCQRKLHKLSDMLGNIHDLYNLDNFIQQQQVSDEIGKILKPLRKIVAGDIKKQVKLCRKQYRQKLLHAELIVEG